MSKPLPAYAPIRLPSATVVAWAALVLALLLAVNQVVLVRRVAALKTTGTATPVAQSNEPNTGDILKKGEFVAVANSEPRLGEAASKYTLIEYSDMDCPFCTRWHATTKQVVSEKPELLSKVFRHLPLETIHPKARPQNEVIACVQEVSPSATWGTVDAVFGRKPYSWTQDEVIASAVSAGASDAQVRACVAAGTGTQLVNEHMTQASELGASGTPFSLLVGPDGSATVISGALAKAQLETYLK